MIYREAWFRTHSLSQEVQDVLRSGDLAQQYALYLRTQGQGFPRGWLKRNLLPLYQQKLVSLRYHGVFFVQGEYATEFFEYLDEHGPEAVIEHIAENYEAAKDPSPSGVHAVPNHGAHDQTYLSNDAKLLLSYNPRLNYMGLEKVEIVPFDGERYDVSLPWLRRI